VNCAAIPQSLIATELFGHEEGAFIGAMRRRAGRFEAADTGTIFLDEIGELPVETQIALLRVLQDQEFERIGSTEPLKVDVRDNQRTKTNHIRESGQMASIYKAVEVAARLLRYDCSRNMESSTPGSGQ